MTVTPNSVGASTGTASPVAERPPTPLDSAGNVTEPRPAESTGHPLLRRLRPKMSAPSHTSRPTPSKSPTRQIAKRRQSRPIARCPDPAAPLLFQPPPLPSVLQPRSCQRRLGTQGCRIPASPIGRGTFVERPRPRHSGVSKCGTGRKVRCPGGRRDFRGSNWKKKPI